MINFQDTDAVKNIPDEYQMAWENQPFPASARLKVNGLPPGHKAGLGRQVCSVRN